VLVAVRYAGQDGTEFHLDHPYSNKHIKEETVVQVGYLPELERSRGDNDVYQTVRYQIYDYIRHRLESLKLHISYSSVP